MNPESQTPPFVVPRITRIVDDAHLTLPGSKSIALRQLAMAALAQGTSTITGVPDCDDADAMLECIAALGADVSIDGKQILVTGPIDRHKDIALDARMSGASTRLLIGIAALRSGRTRIDGHSSLRARTNAPLYDVLRQQGCQVESATGGLPVTITGPLRPADVMHIDASLSSQYVTALLLCAPYCSDDAIDDHPAQRIQIKGDVVSRPYIDITLNEMRKRGVHSHWVDEQTLEVAHGSYQAGEIQIEGDATAATYFAALTTLHGGRLTLDNLGNSTVQGDYQFFSIMEQLGAHVERKPEQTLIEGPSELSTLNVIDMTTMPDAALTLIAMAPLLPATLTIHGLSSLHHKECDRLNCPASEFADLGISAQTTQDSIRIEPLGNQTMRPHTLRTYHDHRMAMAFSLLGSVSGTLGVDDRQVVGKTYPHYWSDYAAVGGLLQDP
ncbi:MAG: 3-phosphoshikimate 1-carboxyvinyltransferase [Pseudomonadaceae bacterium]|nr:3-phosphoshikimate 1-carboxyvinyltransferase [Pseudomonadaceae bacterium]